MLFQLLPGLLGVLAVAACVATTLQSRPFRGGVLTDGTVVAIEARTSYLRSSGGARRPMRTYAPRVEFVDAAGSTRSVTPSSSGGGQPTVGAAVRVSYLPGAPERARVVGDARSRFGSLVFLVVGLGMIAASIALLLN